MKSDSNRLVASVTFAILPILSLPLLFIEIINKKSYAIFLISLFLGMLAYLTVPLYNDDLVRHYEMYQFVSKLSPGEFLLFLYTKPDFLLYTCAYIFSKIGLSRQVLPLLAVCIGYFLKLSILNDYTKNTPSLTRKIYLLFLFIFFLSIDFRSLTLGIRNSTAVIFFIYGTYLYLIKKNKKGWLFILLSPFIHVMIFALIPLLIVAKKLNKPNFFRVVFLLSFIFYFINIESAVLQGMGYISSFVGSTYQQLITFYTEGYWGQEYLEDKSYKGLLAIKLNQIPVFVSLTYLLITRYKSNLRNLAYLTGIITNILYSYPNLYGRYGAVLIGLITILFLLEYVNTPAARVIMNRFLLVFICTFLFKFFVMVYMMRHTIIKSYPKMIYQNSIFVFFNEVTEADYIYK